MLEISVYGASGSGKTSYAEAVRRSAEAQGLTCHVCDHELFSWHKGFAAQEKKIRQLMNERKPDIGIVVINDKAKLRIEFESHLSHRFHEILFPMIAEPTNA